MQSTLNTIKSSTDNIAAIKTKVDALQGDGWTVRGIITDVMFNGVKETIPAAGGTTTLAPTTWGSAEMPTMYVICAGNDIIVGRDGSNQVTLTHGMMYSGQYRQYLCVVFDTGPIYMNIYDVAGNFLGRAECVSDSNCNFTIKNSGTGATSKTTYVYAIKSNVT